MIIRKNIRWRRYLRVYWKRLLAMVAYVVAVVVIHKLGFREFVVPLAIPALLGTALCRTIEINLRQQLGETDLPPKLEPVDGVLM